MMMMMTIIWCHQLLPLILPPASQPLQLIKWRNLPLHFYTFYTFWNKIFKRIFERIFKRTIERTHFERTHFERRFFENGAKTISTQRLEPLFILGQKLTEETEEKKLTEETKSGWFTQNTSCLLKILSIHRFIHTHHVFIRLRKFPNQVFENFWSDYHWRLQPEGKFSIRKRGKQQNQSWHMIIYDMMGSNQTKSHQYTNVQTRTEISTAHDFKFQICSV